MPSGLSGSLQTSFGPLATYALAAVIVLALIAIVFFVAKRAFGGGSVADGGRKGPRLAIVDVASVDQRRKLVLVRRDEVEHLVLIGGQNDLVVEGGILRAPPALKQPHDLRPVARVEPDGGRGRPGPVAEERPTPIAPQPQPRAANEAVAKPPSPLRRAIPQRDARSVVVDPASLPIPGAPNLDAAEPKPVPPVASPVEPTVADAAPPVAAPVPQPRSPSVRHRPSDERRAASPEPSARSDVEPPSAEPAELEPASEENRSAIAPTRLGEREAPPASGRRLPDAAGRVPSFLRREEPVAADAMPSTPEAIAEPEVRPAASTARVPVFERLSPSSIGLRRVETGSPRTDETGMPAEPVAAAPADAGTIEPHAEIRSVPAPAKTDFETPVEPPRSGETTSPEIVEARETAEAGDRGPLSVRSFASVIRSRRPLTEPVRPPSTGETLAVPPRPAPVAAVAEPPVAEPVAKQATNASLPNENDDLDEALVRGLDSDFGSLDWAAESSSAPIGRADKAPEVQPAGPGSNKTKRQEMLEKEMERLLGDFDFNAPRR